VVLARLTLRWIISPVGIRKRIDFSDADSAVATDASSVCTIVTIVVGAAPNEVFEVVAVVEMAVILFDDEGEDS
jgi:hypothetical protein